MKKHLLSILMLALFLSGCASYWSGSLSSNLAIPPEKYFPVKTVSGKASTFIFLGVLGGMDHEDLIGEAKGNLLKTVNLDSNTVLGNWAVSIRRVWFGLGVRQICTVSAEVISLVPLPKKVPIIVEVKPAVSASPSNKPAVIQAATGNIVVGDSVLFSLKGEEFRALVLDVHPSWVKVTHLNSKGKTEEKNVKTKFVTHRIVR